MSSLEATAEGRQAEVAEVRRALQNQEAALVRSQAEVLKAQKGEKELKEEMEVKQLGQMLFFDF